MSLRIRRGTNAQRATTPLDLGELVFTTDTKQLYVGNGIDNGGDPIIRLGTGLAWSDASCTTIIATGAALQVSADATPSLGGNLSLNGYNITGTGDINTTGLSTVSTQKLSMGLLSANESNMLTTTGGTQSTFGGFTLTVSRGTISVPTNTTPGDFLGTFAFKGYFNSTFAPAASLLAQWDITAVLSDGRPASNLVALVGGGSSVVKTTIFKYDGGVIFPGYVKVGSYTPASYPAGGTTSVIAGLVIGSSGDFTCTATTLVVGGIVSILGTNTGSGTVVNGDYYIITTNGTTSFTLSSTRTGTAISTSPGTSVGLTVRLSLPQTGTIIFDSSDNHFYGYNGTAWVAFTGP